MSETPPPVPTRDSTLGEAIDYVIWMAENGGGKCPCCDQRAQEYDRQINSSMALALIKFYQANGREWGHLRKHDHSREGSKLRHWGLLENEKALRPDGGRSGWWRVTDDGESFAQGRLRVARTVWIYDNKVTRVDDSNGTVDINDALGKDFNYSELMSGSSG